MEKVKQFGVNVLNSIHYDDLEKMLDKYKDVELYDIDKCDEIPWRLRFISKEIEKHFLMRIIEGYEDCGKLFDELMITNKVKLYMRN